MIKTLSNKKPNLSVYCIIFYIHTYMINGMFLCAVNIYKRKLLFTVTRVNVKHRRWADGE